MRKFFLVLSLTIVGLVLGCSDESGMADKANEAIGQFSDKNVSQFQYVIDSMSYKTMKPDDQAYDLRWDFSPDKQYEFKYSQTLKNKSDMGSVSDKKTQAEQNMSSLGKLIVKSQPNREAKLVLNNVEATMEMSFSNGETKKMSQVMPPIVVEGMNEMGRISDGGSSQDMLFKLLFPLPEKPVKVGEKITVPIKMPFNAGGSLLFVHGNIELTLSGIVECNENKCALLNSVVKLDEFNQPEEVQGKFFANGFGNGKAVFAIKERRFHELASVFVIKMEATMAMPKTSGSNIGTKDFPEKVTMKMTSDNLIQISR